MAGKTITSVDRALTILDLFSYRTPELGITEIARRMKLPKGTVAGLVYTLESKGYLVQNAESRKYRLGLHVAERAMVALGQFDLLRLAHPHLEKLLAARNKSVNLGVLEGTDVLFVDHISAYVPGSRGKVGNRLAAHATGIGKAILSALPPERFNALLPHFTFPRFTSQTISSRTVLLTELALTRQRGFALDNAESATDILAVAAPVFDWRSQVIAAVSMAMPNQHCSVETLVQWGKDVRATAMNISHELGAIRSNA